MVKVVGGGGGDEDSARWLYFVKSVALNSGRFWGRGKADFFILKYTRSL